MATKKYGKKASKKVQRTMHERKRRTQRPTTRNDAIIDPTPEHEHPSMSFASAEWFEDIP